ncbi:amino acid ABC transporter permease [Rhodoferax sp. PAMC 29310]|uniref:amino acid ABC transporter permease n=1 Tax=Rhodoferax sp. PAMC 29310 TaxID=2822760 RepID=UPI001B3301C9|nr:amino acid ABC transporter permease [Rhodoferax sp. PAMC 29310]
MRIQLDFGAVLAEWPLLLTGVGWTLALTLAAVLVGTTLGLACAWVRGRGFGEALAPRWLSAMVGAYVEVIRNTPFIIQLFFIFFGLPAAGFRLSAESASFIAMVVNLGAYAAEIIRAGLEATPKGQIEAAVSLALTRLQIFIRVVVPPAMKKVWPGLVSQIIIVMLGSSVCGQISTEELSYAADLIQSRNFRSFEAFIVIGVIYLVLSMGLRYALNWLGPKFLFGGR